MLSENPLASWLWSVKPFRPLAVLSENPLGHWLYSVKPFRPLAVVSENPLGHLLCSNPLGPWLCSVKHLSQVYSLLGNISALTFRSLQCSLWKIHVVCLISKYQICLLQLPMDFWIPEFLEPGNPEIREIQESKSSQYHRQAVPGYTDRRFVFITLSWLYVFVCAWV